jgi:hypothetical protein
MLFHLGFHPKNIKHLRRIAGFLSHNQKIKNDSVGTLAKTLTFVKVNDFIHEREALESRKISPQGYGYV